MKSSNIVLDYLAAPTGESPDNGVSTIPDANEDLTVDFGFHGLAIGNKVWLDTITVDGLLGSDEFGVGGVGVELHAAVGDTLLSTATTDELGRYVFTGLTSGTDYVVTIPATQFVSGAPLSGYESTVGNGEPAPDPDDNVDNDDNGVAPATTGGDVDSLPVTVTAAAEPTADGDGLATGADLGAVDDANTNFTIDFGFAASGAGTVGVGNRVWKDLDADGTINSANEDAAGVSGVTVYLHRDDNADGTPDRSNPFLSTTTDSGGYYLFTGIAEGTYIVEIPTENFAASAALDGWFNTTGVVGTGDKNDDGVNPAIPGGAVLTNDIVLSLGGAPTTEPDRPTSTLQWDFGADANIDLTIDFGFTTLSIGNRIFYDENANGTFDSGTDRGTPNVTVELWSDLDVDGTYTLQATTATVAGGYYEFGGLAEGAYKVVVPALNFEANAKLDVLESSPGVTAADTDIDEVDDGIDPTAWGDAVSTGVINLKARTEPTAESPDPWGQEADANANLTIDFGFRRQCLIGGLAWVDTNSNGIHDPGETPAAGVTATLIDDATGQVLATMTTDQYGWYLFEHLTPGSHTWRVDFDAAGVPSQFPTCTLYCWAP